MDRIAALAKSCRIAKVLDPVLNSECAFTFHSPFTSEKGIVVSLTTFVGTVEELGLNGSDEGEEGQPREEAPDEREASSSADDPS